MFTPKKNPTKQDLTDILTASRHAAARRVQDPASGDFWYWPFEQATHAEGADKLGIPYHRKPGDGDVIFLD